MSNSRVIRYSMALIAVLCTVYSADAGVRISHPTARIKIAPETLPDALARGQWSILVWIYAPEAVTEPSSLISIGGRLMVEVDVHGLSVKARHAHQGAVLRIDSPLRGGRWHLLAISMDHRGDTARAWLATQPDGSAEGDIPSDSCRLEPVGSGRSLMRAARPAGDPAVGPSMPVGPVSLSRATPVVHDTEFLPDTAGLVIGSLHPDVPAAMLQYEALVIRDHPLNGVDLDAVWRSRDYYGPYRLDTQVDGGLMNGWRGGQLLAFHGMCSRPNGPGGELAKASWPGAEVNTSNIFMLTQPTLVDPRFSFAFRAVLPVEQASGAVHRSRLEPGLGGFFQIESAPFDAPTEPIGELGPMARMLATEPSGLVRVMVSANSRGTRGSLTPQPWPENFAHGFVQTLLPQTAGVLMRPSTLLDARGGWFGLDTGLTSPLTVLVRSFHSRTDGWADFTRFGSGTLPSVSRGPGPVSNISPGGEYHLRCGPVSDSLLVADAPLVVRSTLLAFPGSSELQWYPERGVMQDGEGIVLGDVEHLALDTTRVVRELSGDDIFLSDTELTLNDRVDVRVGDAVVITSGPGRGAVSVVVGVIAGIETTTAQFSHPFGVRPEAGADMRIGPWRFVSVEHRFDAVPESDDQNWRGQVLRAAADDNMGVMVCGISAWRPDVDGYIFGTAGQGGQGYTPQLENSFPGAPAAWARETQADVWIQGIAGQSSMPATMLDYLDALRDGLGADAEIIWASDAVHAHSSHERWHNFLRDQADAAGVPAVFAVGHPRVGTYFEQAASGMRTDDAHFSSFGNRVIAEAWLDQLRILAGDDQCDTADYNQDGSINVFDLISFQVDWEASDPRADLDGDGRFSIIDYLLLLTAMDRCV